MIENRFANKVIYQLELRTFTPEGTLKAATKLIPHLRDTGFDVLYLCPVCASDDDPDTSMWSERQRKSGAGNPKNSYRIKDYYNVDEEYGTNDDLREFVRTAHDNGMLVLLDLVYFHCGPNAVFLKEHPEFVKRTDDGRIDLGDLWPFPRLNFDVPELREYLWQNMEYWVREFDVDGYRTDVGQLVPDDFWVEGIRRTKKIKPSLLMLNEGYVVDLTAGEGDRGVFDVNYNFAWKDAYEALMNGENNADDLRAQWEADRKYYRGLIGKTARYIDNHDIANDTYDKRHETAWGENGVECSLVLHHLLDGIPFIFNGYEVASSCTASMYASRFSLGVNAIDWSNALLPEGKRRLELMKTLNAIRHGNDAVISGDLSFPKTECSDKLFVYERRLGEKRVTVICNLSKENVSASVSVNVNGLQSLLSRDVNTASEDGKLKLTALPYGYCVFAN